MKRRRILLLLLCPVAAMMLAIFIWPREREPQYNEVALSTWLARCSSTNQAEALAAVDAIRHIGTNTLPVFILWIKYEPRWKILGWPVLGKSRNVQRLIWNMTEYRAITAVRGFQILGSQANPALPELQRLADNPKAPETAIRATHCMIFMTQRFPGVDSLIY